MLLENECGCHIALTIERQLKNYAECNDHTERHEILWHEWNHNKRWLAKIQQLILPSFPAYSMHDASHAEAVLHNIEMILGEENVSRLSATDCFVILHTVYVHDIGMCITHADRKDIIKDEKFLKYLENLCNNGEAELRHYSDVLLQECFESGENLEKEKKRHILNKKLEIYYAVTYLLAEYRRMEHGDISKERLVEWIDAPDKLGAGFSAIEIPRRLFYVIANCANTHTKWDFQVILKSLHQEDTGFAHDYVHPRFIAILLQLGDALDMDNGRFHPLVKEYMGRLPKMSETHYEKHRAIRRLRITNQKISISADCESQDVLRQVRRECDGIRSILKEAAYYWSVIRPKELNVGLPTFEVPVLLLKGNKIPSELVETKFLISQDKAFNLLKGNNIYTDENFVFLRELLQNAVDATKLQYFRDCKMQQQRVHKEDFREPTDANKLISPEKYPIEIEFAIARFKDGAAEKLKGEKLDDIEKQLDGYDCGVLVSIQDYGIGIGAEDIIKIADVGTSYENRKAEIEKMPSWLQPTGTFGIGLQSVFLAGDKLTATTYSHQDIPYQITFYPRQGAEDGYINVLPLTESEEQMPYGTCFQLFVPNSRKKLHSENPETWDGLDPFDKDYDRRRQIRHSIELMKQMALYLTEMVGEPLFPIRLSLKTEGVENERKQIYFTDDFEKLLQRSDMDIYIDDEEKKKLDASKQPPSWIYYMDEDVDKDTIYRNQAGDAFRLDCEKAKLYVWNREYSAYACLGIRRILSMREQINNSEQGRLAKGVEIFYKGIRVTERFFRKDANLIEYIDLKQTLDSSELKLNRNGFSREGDKHLDAVYEAIVAASRKALKYFGDHKTESESIQNRIITRIKELLTAKEDPKEILSKKIKAEEVILSATALAYFAMLDETDDLFEDKNKCDVQLWKKLLEDIDNLRREVVSKEIYKNMNDIWGKSTLYSITLYTIENNVVMKMKDEKNKDKDCTVSILDIIDRKRKYAVISIRDKKSRFWRECLVELGQQAHEGIKEDIKKLRSMSDLKSRKDIMDNLYRKAERFLNGNLLEENREVGQLRKEGAILKWILNNVPTMALFSNFDGNIRMNVLDMEVCNSVYFDENMRALTIERIREKFTDTKISRFSTIVWSGYRYLGVAETRASIQSVKRGKISSIGNCEMVFPLTGEGLEDLNNKIERQMKNLQNETKAFYESIIEPLFAYIEEKLLKDNAFAINNDSSRYWKELCWMLLREDEESPYGEMVDEKERMERLSDDDCERFVQSLNRKIEGNKSEDSGQVSENEENKKVNQAIVRLKRVWEYRGDSTEALKLHEYCETEKFRNLVGYTVSNARMKPSEQQVETLYFNYICEVKDIMWMSKEKTILKDFDKDFAKALIERVWSQKESKEE